MAQEIITYLIVAVSVCIALWKMYKTVAGRKKPKKKNALNKVTYSPQHNCSDCIAECTLRDAIPLIRQENEELCETTVVKYADS